MKRITQKIFKAPENIKKDNYRFFIVTNYMYMLSFFGHFSMILGFSLLGVKLLALFNIISCTTFVVCYYINRKGYHKIALIPALIELILHCYLSTFALGWGSGFHYYLLVITPIAFFIVSKTNFVKYLLVIILAVSYITLSIISVNIIPWKILPLWILNITNNFNIFVSFITASFIGYYYSKAVLEAEATLEKEYKKSESLLLNILPQEIVDELKEKGFTEPGHFDDVSVMFTDFKGFTNIAESLTPAELIKELDNCFDHFDNVTEKYNLEKLKTIGDSFMCAGGIPIRNKSNAVDCVLAAMEIQGFMNQMKSIKETLGLPYWELRLGIHSGSVIAGVIGNKKFAYDIWGDTVNTASRMESSGITGKINISYSTYQRVKDFFECEYRGKVSAKHKGEIEMYFVNRIKPELTKDEECRIPNEKFFEMYNSLK